MDTIIRVDLLSRTWKTTDFKRSCPWERDPKGGKFSMHGGNTFNP